MGLGQAPPPLSGRRGPHFEWTTTIPLHGRSAATLSRFVADVYEEPRRAPKRPALLNMDTWRRDYYELLARGAGTTDKRVADSARELHPSEAPDAGRFRELQVLSNSETRELLRATTATPDSTAAAWLPG